MTMLRLSLSRYPLLLVTASVALVLIISACGLFDDPGFIVYAEGKVGERDVVVMDPEGDHRRVVVGGDSDDFAPVWSPDQSRIAFLSDRDGNIELYAATPDGSSIMRITNSAVAESQPTWSPDSQRIAYTAPELDGRPRIVWVNLSDLQPNRLIFGSDSELDPTWSPGGTWVAFTSLDEMGKPQGLFLRNPDGVDELRISESPDSSPAWSPDGKKLAFVSTRDGNEEIYMVEIGPRGPEGQAQRVTDNPARDFAPSWSPEGQRIVFLSDRAGGVDIFSVSKKGEDLRALTRNDFDELAVSWGPDGRIVFESRPTGESDLFVMDADGNQHQISSGSRPSTQPDW